MKIARLLPLAVAATLPLAACGPREDAAADNADDVVLNEEGVATDDLSANAADANLVEGNALAPTDAPLANDGATNAAAPGNAL